MVMTMHVDIVSAEEQIFSGRAEMLVASGELGELGIAPSHAPLLTRLIPGQVRLMDANGKEQVFYVSGGILEVLPQTVTVLADTAVRADDLDEAAAVQAQERAQQAIKDQKADFNYAEVSTQLARAAAQLRVIRTLRKKVRK